MMRTLTLAVSAFLMVGTAMAEDGVASGASTSHIAAAICMGIAVLGGALGQSKAAAAALEGLARNPGAQKAVFVPMIIALALIESLVLLAFVVAFIKIPA